MINEKRIQKVIAEYMAVEKSKINEHTTLEELGADSLDAVELIMAIEEEFKIEITDDEGDACKIVRDIIILVAKKQAE